MDKKKRVMIVSEYADVDVLVIGGGTAGTCAAISAVRTGADTLLIEKNGRLGGTMTNAMVNYPGLFHAWGKQIIDGPCWEAIKRVFQIEGVTFPNFKANPEKHYHNQIKLNIFLLSAVFEQMCVESDARVLMHTMVSDIVQEDGKNVAILTTKEGMISVNAKVIIDATGDANIAGLMGYERIMGEEVQPGSLMNHLEGYDVEDVNKKELQRLLQSALDKKEIYESDYQKEDMYHLLERHRLLVHVTGIDGSTSQGKTKAEFRAKEVLLRLITFLKKVPGLENLFVSNVGEECGIRETYRIVGEKKINYLDYINGVVYPDAVCYSFYPIDFHVSHGIKQIFLKEGIFPTIPYGALIPKSASNLLVAGRCIAGDQYANSAYRVQATSMATGQVAGVAASIAALQNLAVSQVELPQLKEKLKEIGAIVPEKNKN